MIEVNSTNNETRIGILEPAPTLHISGGYGSGNTNETEVHIASVADGHIMAQGWYRISDILIAVHAAGATGSKPATVRLTEPAIDVVAS